MERDAVNCARDIRALVLDVDGVLTDGRLYCGPDGREYKAFHVRDGHGLVMLLEAGIGVGIISGRRSEVVERRMRELGVRHVLQGVADKDAGLSRLLAALDIGPGQTCYVGDDVPDMIPMRRVGFAVAVADAHPSVKDVAHWRTTLPGGFGAVREVCDLLLNARAKL